MRSLVHRVLRHLPNDAIVWDDGSPYMRRYWLVRLGSRHIRIHEILLSDDMRSLHDHPWDFWSVGLAGGYTEHGPDGSRHLRAPWVVRRRAADLHALELDRAPVWTLVVTGPKRKDWGFDTPEGFVPWWDYDTKLSETGRVRGRLAA